MNKLCRCQVQLQHVDRTLKRIASGGYGICSACDDDIGLRRLEFDPAATLCIACARARET